VESTARISSFALCNAASMYWRTSKPLEIGIGIGIGIRQKLACGRRDSQMAAAIGLPYPEGDAPTTTYAVLSRGMWSQPVD
jgi:hypothetical protein